MSSQAPQRLLLGCSIAFYVFSLIIPAVDNLNLLPLTFERGTRPIYGVELLLTGWLGLLSPTNPGWLANIGYVATVIIFINSKYEDKMVCYLAGITLVLGLSSLLLIIYQPEFVPTHGHIYDIQFLPGFYLWIFSFVLLLLASLIKIKIKHRGGKL